MTATEPRPANTAPGADPSSDSSPDSNPGPNSGETAEPTFEELAVAVDEAAKAVAELEPEARTAADELKAAIEAFHRPALVAMVRTLRDDPRGKELLFELVDLPEVRAVLALQGIIKADPATRAEQALNRVRPYLQSHGGDVELVRIEQGAAFVRLQGSCNGCSMSAVTLRETVEEALVADVDEVDRVEVVEDQPTAAFIPLESVGVRRTAESGWLAGPAADEVPAGGMVRFDVTVDAGAGSTSDESFVATNIDQRIAVFRNACIHQGLSLDGGMISEGVLTCPWHGFTFDASSGECISAPGAQLQQVPTRVEDGRVWVRATG
jgi:Fe-S cluster biogenesis protein NfuA/nitrite reductase/ring-hydroxylating ferredoxin subunit